MVLDFNLIPFSSPPGHFTQVVWNATTHVGLGLARKDSEDSHLVIVVANYAPAGNVLGKFKDNVSRPTSRKSGKNVTENTTEKNRPSSDILDDNVTANNLTWKNVTSKDVSAVPSVLIGDISVENVTVSDLTWKNVSSKDMSAQKSKGVTPKDISADNKTSKIISAKNITQDTISGKNVSTKTITSENETTKDLTTKTSSSKIVTRRDVRGLRMFHGRIAHMSSTPCPEK